MIKILVFRVTLCILIVSISLVLIFCFAPLPNSKKNGFTRTFFSFTLKKDKQSILPLEATKISGSTLNRYYLTGLNPAWVLVLDSILNPIDTIVFGVRQTERFLTPNTTIDSPYIYMYAGNLSYLIKGNINESTITPIKLQTEVFLRSVQISNHLLIIRGFNKLKKQVFKQVDCNNGLILKEAQILDDDNTLGLSTDGYLYYDTTTNKIIYVQSYRNSFLCLDTNLNIIYRGKTIDTVSHFSLNLHKESGKSEFKITSATNRIQSNLISTVSDGKLFVASALKADNEKIVNFSKNFPIDVYAITNGEYLGTFYIPRLEKKKILSMSITKKNLLILYPGNELISFHIPDIPQK